MNIFNSKTSNPGDKALIPYEEWIRKMCPRTPEEEQAYTNYLLEQPTYSYEDTFHGYPFN